MNDTHNYPIDTNSFEYQYLRCKYNKNERFDEEKYRSFYLENAYKYHFMKQDDDEASRLIKLYQQITLTDFSDKDYYLYFYNPYYVFTASLNNYTNGTLDYSLILNHSLEEMKAMAGSNAFKKELDAIEKVIDIIVERNKDNKYSKYLLNIKDKHPTSLDEALQRILFVNQLLWQTHHMLMGFGRLDYNLDPFIKNLSDQEIEECLSRFFLTLHKDYKEKSSTLFGDTGQIIIIGGLNKDGTYFSNRLTELFIKVCTEVNVNDPKLFLRVANNIPRKLLELSARCLEKGNGSPLFSNDEVVIPSLKRFGYENDDCYQYVCSACWEPFIEKLSGELNNLATINFLSPLTDVLKDISDINNFDELVDKYLIELKVQIDNICERVHNYVMCEDILASCFNEQCLTKGLTFKDKGAKYNNFGCTGVGLGNAINSLSAIKGIVYLDKKMDLKSFVDIVHNNFSGAESLVQELKDNYGKYCVDEKEIIDLTNKIVNYTSMCIEANDRPTRKLKFGLSAPSYVWDYYNQPATPDGRKTGEPSMVHISPSVGLSYTEIVNFASKINYQSRCFNGNVVDLMINPSFIKNNFDKFVDFLRLSIKQGFYQLQANVVGSKVLIDAKAHPENYQSLIVRVWGFSAYFVELPVEFQDVLIARALANEAVN